ncbi:MAG: TonB-dependent receptor, partial [Sediminibacterium sp.]
DTRTQQELWPQLSQFIDNHPYLSKHRGEYAQRNATILPWTGRVDLNVTQDVNFKVKGRKQTLRFTADIYNFTNLLSRNLGIYDVPTSVTPLTFTGAFQGNKPVFSFPYFNTTTKTPLQQAWRHDTGMASRYQVQLGVRYIF